MRDVLCRFGRTGIDDMQQQRRFSDFFERGAEGFDERRRQITDEPDSVAEERPPVRRQRQVTHGGIERGEHARVGHHRGAGEPVK